MCTVNDETPDVVPGDPDVEVAPESTDSGIHPDGTPAPDGDSVPDSPAAPDSATAPAENGAAETESAGDAPVDPVAQEPSPDEPSPADSSPADTSPEEAADGEVTEQADDDSAAADADADVDDTDVPEAEAAETDAAETGTREVDETDAAASDLLPATQLDPEDNTWWRSAIFYQIYPRSFSDGNGDGVGDLAGVIDKLGYLELLGVNAIWLSPIMRSPMADHGYDVSDPRDIDPLFGDLATFDAMVADAHDRGIRVTMDLVPNHTSDQHPWFAEAIAAGPGSPERARYIFRDGRGENGDEPPNNWVSIFGGPAWHRVTEADGTPGQWYLHIFAPEQPDLNWDNDEVFEDMEKTLRFWLDRGVDGFRIDVAHGMAKPSDLPDMNLETAGLLENSDDDPRFNNYGVHEIHRKIRAVIDEYPGVANVGEIWVDDNERFAEYLRPDELHLGFNFRLAKAPFEAKAIRSAIENSLAAVLSVDGTPTWTLSNHDVDREVTRYSDDLETGIARARAMLLVELALPGTVFIYNGAELGLPNVDLPDEALQDPVWERSGHTERGRDGCRVPLPWQGTEPPFGFSTSSQTWLPMPESWVGFTVEAQLEDVGSTLSLYRQAIDLRAERPEFSGDTVEWYGAPEGCLAFRRADGHLVCALNAGDKPVPLPPGEVLLTSAQLDKGLLPPNASAWLV